MKLKSLLSFCLTLLVFSGCDDTFVVNADWKDITIIYGLLNQNEKDSIHYIKINKAYLNENTSAIELAKEPDSLYYKDSLTVLLEEWNGSNLVRNIYLYKEFSNNKDSGMFAYPGQYLYRTPVTPLSVNYLYKLVVKNPQTGKEMTSQTTLVGNLSPLFPKQNGQITFKSTSVYDIKWYSGKNAFFYDLTIDINYIEYPRSNPTLISTKVIHWPIFSYQRTTDLSGMELMTISLPGVAFFDIMNENIPVDMNIDREFKSFDLNFSAGGQEIYYYINVNKPSIGIIQKKPEYSNINNALGVFSSRNQNNIHAYLSSISLDELKKNSKTIDLNFVK
jgi:hypothetical protein